MSYNVNYDLLDSTGITISDSDRNPFLIDIYGSPLFYTKMSDIVKQFNNVYIICLKKNIEINDDIVNKMKLFYEQDISIKDLQLLNEYLTLLHAPIEVLKYKIIRKGTVQIESKHIQPYNDNRYSMNETELVYLLPLYRSEHVQNWLNIYLSSYLFSIYASKKIFYIHTSLSGPMIENDLIRTMNSLVDFQYWENPDNCNLSNTEKFIDRKFNLNFKWDLNVDKINDEMHKYLTNFQTNVNRNSYNYPSQLIQYYNFRQKINNKSETVSILPKSYYKTFDVNKLELDYDIIEEFLINEKTSIKEKLYLYSNLLISNTCCHFAISEKILQHMKPIIQKFNPLFRYLFGYAWNTLTLEEKSIETKTTKNDRYVIPINAAALLPTFPFIHENPHLNPYFCLLVPDRIINSKTNIYGVHPIKREFDVPGIVNLTEFKRRLCIFTTGKSDKDIFFGLDWTDKAITGGVMSAIIPEYNPLMYNYNTSGKITDDDLIKFFDKYYSESDIDIACKHKTIFEYLADVNNIKNTIQRNLGITTWNIVPTKTLGIHINLSILKVKCESKEIPFTYEYLMSIKENINKMENQKVKYYFYNLYLLEKHKKYEDNLKFIKSDLNDEFFFEYIKNAEFTNTNLIFSSIIKKSEEDNKEVDYSEKNSIRISTEFLTFIESIKFKLSCKELKHPIEIFWIKGDDFFSTVAKFHLPCVRSYYDGTDCYLLPSAISTYMTFTCQSFTYFIGSKDPIMIIIKYLKKAYGVVLNPTEIKQYLAYLKVKEYPEIIGSLDLNNDIYEKTDKKNESTDLHIKTMTDYISHYHSKYSKIPDYMLTIRTINEDGNINPVKRWYIDACYDILNK